MGTKASEEYKAAFRVAVSTLRDTRDTLLALQEGIEVDLVDTYSHIASEYMNDWTTRVQVATPLAFLDRDMNLAHHGVATLAAILTDNIERVEFHLLHVENLEDFDSMTEAVLREHTTTKEGEKND